MKAPPQSDSLVFFGATGDLAYKKIFPALQALVKRGVLNGPIVGVARGRRTVDELRERAKDSLEHNGGLDRDSFDKLAALLRYGARVDHRYHGATPLHYVVKAGFVRTIQVLLEHGADAGALDDRGRTPLDWLGQAAKSVDRDAVRDALQRASPRS